jgi:carboxymethylenebutenolidase
MNTSSITFPSNGGSTPGFLARPDGPGPFPAIVAIQEWWGLVPHIKDVAGRFAQAGFVALAPDLYHGQVADEPDEARKLAMELDRDRAVVEIRAAARWLQDLEVVAPRQVGVIGWCMGGSLSIASAASGDEFSAAVAFYGMPRDAAIATKIKAPVLGLYGSEDHGITPDAIQALEAALQAGGVTHEIHVYPGAVHAFFNDSRPHIYQPEPAADAWQRTLAWFRRYLA